LTDATIFGELKGRRQPVDTTIDRGAYFPTVVKRAALDIDARTGGCAPPRSVVCAFWLVGCHPMTLGVDQSMSTEGGKPPRRGGEMSQSPTISALTPDVTEDAEPAVVNGGISDGPVLITVQQVMFGTAAVVSPRRVSNWRRLIEAVRGVGAALRRPPARHYPPRRRYLEDAGMAREMHRL
jgi:hypothetical protein